MIEQYFFMSCEQTLFLKSIFEVKLTRKLFWKSDFAVFLPFYKQSLSQRQMTEHQKIHLIRFKIFKYWIKNCCNRLQENKFKIDGEEIFLSTLSCKS